MLIAFPKASVPAITSMTSQSMLRRAGELVASGVTVVVVLALSDDGTPAYDHAHAEALTALGATVLSSTPDEFPELLARVLA